MRSSKEIATSARFIFNTCIIVVVQSIVLSAVVGMVNEAVINGKTDQTAEDLLGTSAVLFALSLASALYGAMTVVHKNVSSITNTVVVAGQSQVSELKTSLGDEWIPSCQVGKVYASKSRVQLKHPISLLPVGAALAAGGALLLTVAVGASYYDVALAFEEQGLTPADVVNNNGRRRSLRAGEVYAVDDTQPMYLGGDDGLPMAMEGGVLSLDSLWEEASKANDADLVLAGPEYRFL